MEKRNIEISDGSTLELECTEEFYKKVRSYLMLDEEEQINDHHIKTFFYDTLKSTLDNLEKGNYEQQ